MARKFAMLTVVALLAMGAALTEAQQEGVSAAASRPLTERESTPPLCRHRPHDVATDAVGAAAATKRPPAH